MKKIALIPARYASTRFPYKLMQVFGGKTVIRHTYDNTVATGLFDAVMVVTDNELIFNDITEHGGMAMMSRDDHESGSDRIAEAAALLEADLILNVQGDEPFIDQTCLRLLLDAFQNEQVQVASVMKKIQDEAQIQNPNVVKVVVDLQWNSLLFSRSPIPFQRDRSDALPVYYEHIGIYAFRREALLRFPKMPMTPLEKSEKIECLRFLENGIPLKMVLTDFEGVKIDVPDDLPKAVAYWDSLQQHS